MRFQTHGGDVGWYWVLYKASSFLPLIRQLLFPFLFIFSDAILVGFSVHFLFHFDRAAIFTYLLFLVMLFLVFETLVDYSHLHWLVFASSPRYVLQVKQNSHLILSVYPSIFASFPRNFVIGFVMYSKSAISRLQYLGEFLSRIPSQLSVTRFLR